MYDIWDSLELLCELCIVADSTQQDGRDPSPSASWSVSPCWWLIPCYRAFRILSHSAPMTPSPYLHAWLTFCPAASLKKKKKFLLHHQYCCCHIQSVSISANGLFQTAFAPLAAVLSTFLCAKIRYLFFLFVCLFFLFLWSKTSAEQDWRIKSGWIFMAEALSSIQPSD